MSQIVISLGGSLVCPDGVDATYLGMFKDMIVKQSAKSSFYIVVGGGKVARQYIAAVKAISPDSSNEELDKVGIAAGLLNSQLVLSAFGNNAYHELARDYNTLPTRVLAQAIWSEETSGGPKHKIFINGSYIPGRSSDSIAVNVAMARGVDTVINLTNVDCLYDSDPKTNLGARKIERISWKQYSAMIGDSWEPGANYPFDPVASRTASEAGLKVIITHGKNLDNLERIIEGESNFQGTIIK